jgi:CRP/FNR family transcriptional regulator
MALEPDVRAALARSHFHALPEALTDRLTAGAMRLELPAGIDLVTPGSPGKFMLVVGGLLKTYLIAPSGRLATIRYARPGDLLGAPILFDLRPSPAGSRTLTPSTVLLFDLERVRALASTEVQVAQVFNVELSLRLAAYFAELAGTTFGSLRERVARHLLDVSSDERSGPPWVARLSQQDLADAVGSVREVVTRVLSRLREDGLVRTGDGEIELLDPARLAGEAAPGVTKVTPERNRGR